LPRTGLVTRYAEDVGSTVRLIPRRTPGIGKDRRRLHTCVGQIGHLASRGQVVNRQGVTTGHAPARCGQLGGRRGFLVARFQSLGIFRVKFPTHRGGNPRTPPDACPPPEPAAELRSRFKTPWSGQNPRKTEGLICQIGSFETAS
jgi:hypothetical protein